MSVPVWGVRAYDVFTWTKTAESMPSTTDTRWQTHGTGKTIKQSDGMAR